MRPVAGVLLLLACTLSPAAAFAKDQRSVQNECRREAERRGYSVLESRNFRRDGDGWSLELQARDHRGRATWGTCFVENRSGDVSLYGFGWGGSDAGSTFDFYCASPDYKYRECQLPVSGRARLVKKKSDASCVENRDWGQRNDRLWVDHGCRGDFQVVRHGGGTVTGEPAVAERACLKEAERLGLRVVSRQKAHSLPGGYGFSMTVRRGNQPQQPAHCTYLFSTGRATLNY
jgi:Protein of unknown function (DUF3011)